MHSGHTIAHFERLLDGRPDGYEWSDYDEVIGVYVRDEVRDWINERLPDEGDMLRLLLGDLLDFGDTRQWTEIGSSFRPGRDDLDELRSMAGEDNDDDETEDE
jgi:hypothetical protein